MAATKQLIQQVQKRKRTLNLMQRRRLISKIRWYICKRQRGECYCLADFDDDHSTAMWSKHKTNAMTFKTEAGVYQFISTYLNDRSDVIVVQEG